MKLAWVVALDDLANDLCGLSARLFDGHLGVSRQGDALHLAALDSLEDTKSLRSRRGDPESQARLFRITIFVALAFRG